ncbi:MAG: hypothetical protein M9890_13250 [Thermomicrobiales bacterium]|nr:hypothetical protein [Thermomicrobiales bacterium]
MVDTGVRAAGRKPGASRSERAAALYQGELLAGFNLPSCEAFEDWLLLKRESCASER